MRYIFIRRGNAKTDMLNILYETLCSDYISMPKWCKNVHYQMYF